MKRFFRKFMLTLFTGTFLVSVAIMATPLIEHQLDLWNVRQQQKDLDQLYQNTLASQDPDLPAIAPDDQASASATPLPKFEPFLALNPETVGWLTLGGGDLSAPVLQHSDNDYYLKTNFYNQPDEAGAVALDHRNNILPSADGYYDDNWVLYAHNLRNSNLMFHALTNFRDADYLAKNSVIGFDSLYTEGQYVIFSVFLTNTDPAHGPIFDYHNQLRFSYQSQKEDYLTQAIMRTMLTTGVDVNADDRLLTLSTCSYEFDDARLVVMARRLRPGERADQFSNLTVAKNTAALMPDIWESMYGSKTKAS